MKIISISLCTILLIVLSILIYETVVHHNQFVETGVWDPDVVLSAIYSIVLIVSIYLSLKKKYVVGSIIAGLFILFFLIFVVIFIPTMNG